jgi:hypothetical protein
MNAEKIDIIEKLNVAIYGEDQSLIKVVPLQEINAGLFIDTFSDDEDLLTVNINNPFKRIVKFYNINESVPMNFIEIDYSSMSSEEKIIFDNFVYKIDTLIS